MPTTTLSASTTTTGVNIASGDDGTLTLKTGSTAGAQVNALSFAADGTPTFLKVPANSAVQSMVRVNTANGFGSTNTVIRKYTNVTNGVNGCVIQGSDLTFSNDATNGASVTVNTSGVYACSVGDTGTTAIYLGLSLNTTQPTVAIQSITNAGEVLAMLNVGANSPAATSWTGYLAAGSVVRPHLNGVAVGSNPSAVQFTITRVS
jgi:hypothetical protein